MEGWNDCPLPMLAGGAGRARKRTSRAINLRRIIHANPSTSSENILHSRTAPPLPPADVSKETVDSKLRNVIETFKLDENENEFTVKLLDSLETLNLEQLKFINGIIGSLLASPPAEGQEAQISNYMMKNGEESDWCLNLNSLVRALKNRTS